jgi:uncharacterized protein (TIGR03435 family)
VYSSSDRKKSGDGAIRMIAMGVEDGVIQMRCNRIWCKLHVSRISRRGLTWSVAGAIALLLVVNGVWSGAQAAAPATPPAQAAAPATAPPSSVPVSPTDIVGVWQGTLHIPAAANHPQIDLRLVFKISKTDAGALKAVWYSIDQGSQSVPMATISFQDGVLKFTSAMVPRSYEGKMSADGKSIAGTWMEDTTPIQLPLERANADTAWAIPEPPKPMAADANPGFDVVTIKPSAPGAQGKGFGFRGTHFVTRNTNLNDLVAFAYGLHSKQIIGAPDWFGTDLFDIDGTPDVPGQPSLHQMEMMVQKLLPDRFALKFHRDQRELSVYIITVASGGPKMTKTTAGPNDPQGFGFRGLGDLTVRNMNMKEFASWMQSGVMDRPVVDHTGLTDKYDFQLKWTPDDSQFAQFRGVGAVAPPAGDNPDAPPSLYTAVQERLGLKIEAGKAMDDVIVIDHVEKPSPN